MTEQELLTADDLLRLHSEGVRGELIRGVLEGTETMPTGARHGKIVVRLSAALFAFVEPEQLGTLLSGDPGVRLEHDPDTVRAPDIAYFSTARMPIGADIPGFVEVAPDLVVEILSPSDSLRRVHDKARMWLSHGVSLVWVVHPDTRAVDVHRPGRAVVTFAGDDNLDGGDVLDGFACALADIFGP